MQDNPFGLLFNLGDVYLLWIAFNFTYDEFLVGLIDGNEIDFVLPIFLLPIVGNQVVPAGLSIRLTEITFQDQTRE